jgi:Bifunctional DNA primase/polymerase, N-terminal/Primase C terminal 1 (PriCT-1)
MLEHALALARRGLYVFPCQRQGKTPATAHGCKDATRDPAVIENLWRPDPGFNIAIATGKTSHVFVLDVDDEDAETLLRQLEAEHGALPASVEAITARGRHIYFEWPDRPVSNSAGKLGPGLDIRASGGYVIAPPSIHPSGKKYTWSCDSAKTFAAAPGWLLAKIAATSGNGYTATPPAEWREMVCGGVDEGRRNAAIARLTGLLLQRRIDPVVARELAISWDATHCRPSLGEAEVTTIVNSICGRELKRRGQP